ncbi:hypothetical protein [Rhodococcus sp. USK10]|uniref:hypothetical protein n=1 Tax=Rhodococcus sp. USK10 TaxID=2789739 RepID=UPI0035B520EB
MINRPSTVWRRGRVSVVWRASNSSPISPTTSSTMSSSVTMPAVPPDDRDLEIVATHLRQGRQRRLGRGKLQDRSAHLRHRGHHVFVSEEQITQLLATTESELPERPRRLA